MKKTVAKIRHRDFVPEGWFAIEFCEVNFYGFRAKEMDKKWRDIIVERFEKYNPLFEENKIKIKEMRDKAEDLQEQVSKSQQFFRFWYTPAEKEKIKEAHEITIQANKLEKENEDLAQLRFFGQYEEIRRIEELLEENGFILTSTSSEGGECVVETDIWTLEE